MSKKKTGVEKIIKAITLENFSELKGDMNLQNTGIYSVRRRCSARKPRLKRNS